MKYLFSKNSQKFDKDVNGYMCRGCTATCYEACANLCTSCSNFCSWAVVSSGSNM